eukprot:g2358.t1
MYRLLGLDHTGDAKSKGNWFSFNDPTGKMTYKEYREKYEICKAWQTDFRFIQEVVVPKDRYFAYGPGEAVTSPNCCADPANCGDDEKAEQYPKNMVDMQVFWPGQFAKPSKKAFLTQTTWELKNYDNPDATIEKNDAIDPLVVTLTE